MNNDLDRLFDHLLRQTIGLDRLQPYVNRVNATFPPYDIIKASDNDYVISIAIAGYKSEDIDIEFKNDVLTVRTIERTEEPETTITYVHKGIAKRRFQLTFPLDQHMEVVGAGLADGLLTINIHRNIPEREIPRKIAISTGQPTSLLLEDQQ
jgi:HSP20 family molecular chaperone IbpA